MITRIASFTRFTIEVGFFLTWIAGISFLVCYSFVANTKKEFCCTRTFFEGSQRNTWQKASPRAPTHTSTNILHHSSRKAQDLELCEDDNKERCVERNQHTASSASLSFQFFKSKMLKTNANVSFHPFPSGWVKMSVLLRLSDLELRCANAIRREMYSRAKSTRRPRYGNAKSKGANVADLSPTSS